MNNRFSILLQEKGISPSSDLSVNEKKNRRGRGNTLNCNTGEGIGVFQPPGLLSDLNDGSVNRFDNGQIEKVESKSVLKHAFKYMDIGIHGENNELLVSDKYYWGTIQYAILKGYFTDGVQISVKVWNGFAGFEDSGVVPFEDSNDLFSICKNRGITKIELHSVVSEKGREGNPFPLPIRISFIEPKYFKVNKTTDSLLWEYVPLLQYIPLCPNHGDKSECSICKEARNSLKRRMAMDFAESLKHTMVKKQLDYIPLSSTRNSKKLSYIAPFTPTGPQEIKRRVVFCINHMDKDPGCPRCKKGRI